MGDGKPRLALRKRTHPQGLADSQGIPLPGLSRQAHREGMTAVPFDRTFRRWSDGDLPRVEEMEGTSQGFDCSFLDRPEQGCGRGQIAARQPRGMFKLCWLENPVQGVFTLKFIGPCHIDADVSPISAQGGPDRSAALAEGDGRAWRFTQQELRSAQQTTYQLYRQSLYGGGLTVLPTRTCRDRKVIPKGGDEAVPGLIAPWQAGMEDRPASVRETHGMHGCSLAIHSHGHSHASSRSPFLPSLQVQAATQCIRNP